MKDTTFQELTTGSRRALLGIAALVTASLAIVFFATWSGLGVQKHDPWVVEDGLSLVFRDGADGEVFVVDAMKNDVVATFQSGDGGFARTALRALAYSRRVHGISPEEPLILGESTNGRLVIHDPATNKSIGVDAFGDVNAAQFAELLR